jgi:hypothetical protein
MAYLPEDPVWEQGIYQYEITDKLQSGAGGIDNLQGNQLANRTGYLKKGLEDERESREEGDAALQQQVDTMKGRGGYLTAHDFGDFGGMAPEDVQQALTDYALSQINQTEPETIWNGTHVKNLFDSRVWVLTNTPDTEPAIFEWTDDGFDSIKQGDNDGTLGVVSGGLGFDDVFIDPQGKMRVRGLKAFQAAQIEGYGRDLMEVLLGHPFSDMTTQALINEAIAEVIAAIRARSNNNGEIDGSGIPNYSGMIDGDFLDGLDLSAIGAPTGGTAPQPWNKTYKNNRLLISGFNSYKYSGDTEVTKNHVVFAFRNIVAKGRMNATNVNAGGYNSTELRAWLEGASGDGSGSFSAGLKTALGGNNPILTIRKLLSNKTDWAWINATVFLLSTLEVFGSPGFGQTEYNDGVGVHLPIYQQGSQYRVKRWNGARDWWWLSSPSASSAAYFCSCSHNGDSSYYSASGVGGVAPAFCVA